MNMIPGKSLTDNASQINVGQTSSGTHIPVLLKEVIKYLDPGPDKTFIDCTPGGGGHIRAILERGAKVLAIEWDDEIFKSLESEKLEGLTLVNDTYANLEEIAKECGFVNVSGILFDLGMSSYHLDKSGRGFTFRYNEPLDMRYNTDSGLTAKDIVNTWPQKEIENILKIYGEEKRAGQIAGNIVRGRPIETTFDLKRAIGGKRGRIDPATKTFQALRIVVNAELNSLMTALDQSGRILSERGRLAVISFHSLEDRIVKNAFKKLDLEILTKKPIMADRAEVRNNPRARSVRLRVGRKR